MLGEIAVYVVLDIDRDLSPLDSAAVVLRQEVADEVGGRLRVCEGCLEESVVGGGGVGPPDIFTHSALHRG